MPLDGFRCGKEIMGKRRISFPSLALRVILCLAPKQSLWCASFPTKTSRGIWLSGTAVHWSSMHRTPPMLISQTTRSITKTTTPTNLKMNFLSEFFGSFQEKMNTGGSYNLGIDYESLAFPGPEIGRMAIAITQARRRKAQPSGNKNDDDDSFFHPSRSSSYPHLELATFAGGCFWGLELAFQRLEGIEYTLVGYTQGLTSEIRPNYEQVSAGNTHHCEAVLVYFDPTKISYEKILSEVFLERVDITTVNGQGKDFGRQYRTGIYFHTNEQEETAKKLLSNEISTNPKYSQKNAAVVATELKRGRAFWPAEEYHQRYLEKGVDLGDLNRRKRGIEMKFDAMDDVWDNFCCCERILAWYCFVILGLNYSCVLYSIIYRFYETLRCRLWLVQERSLIRWLSDCAILSSTKGHSLSDNL